MCWNSHLHTHTQSTFNKNHYENLNAGQICFSLLQILRKMFCALTSRQVAASCLSLFKGAAPQFQPLQHYCPHTATRPPVRPYQGCTTNQPTQPTSTTHKHNQHNQQIPIYQKKIYITPFTSTLQYTKIMTNNNHNIWNGWLIFGNAVSVVSWKVGWKCIKPANNQMGFGW